jgi:hypothetical protein
MLARVLLFLIAVLRPFFLLIRFVLRLIYQVLFSWWLNPAFGRWIRNGFEQEIRLEIPSLFDLHGGRMIPDPKPYTNDDQMDYLCVGSISLIFKFRRWRRENYGVQVAPTFAPTEFYELPNVLRVVEPTADTKLQMLEVSWRLWGQLLEPRFHLVEKAFDSGRFPDTKSTLASSH